MRILHNAKAAVPQMFDDNVDMLEQEGSELFLVMEHIPGLTLKEMVEQGGPLSLDAAAAIVSKIAEVVSVAHAQNVLHRDLKPDNLIVRDAATPVVVVIDYGLSYSETDDDLTRATETIRNKFLDLPENNTPGGNRRDSRSDITHLCGILYFCLTGHVPGHLQSSDGRAPHRRTGYSVQEKLGDDPRLRRLEMFFDAAFAPNIEYRFQSVGDMSNRLKECLDSADHAIENPVAVAKRAGERMRRGDRKTQLQEFSRLAKEVTQMIQQYGSSIHKELEKERFHLIFTGVSNSLPMPKGIDAVPQGDVAAQINASHHNHLSQALYQVASRGEQCVLLRLNLFREGDSGPIKPQGGWQEVCWFNAEALPDKEVVLSDFKRWINTSIEDLISRIAP
jgi:serine/threonine protein kinase